MEYFLNTVVEVLDIHGEVFILVMTIAMSVFLWTRLMMVSSDWLPRIVRHAEHWFL